MEHIKTIELSAKILVEIFNWKPYKIDDFFVLQPSKNNNFGYKLHDSLKPINQVQFSDIDINKLNISYVQIDKSKGFNAYFLARIPNFAEDKNLFPLILNHLTEIGKINDFNSFISNKFSLVDFYSLNQYDSCLLVMDFLNNLKGDCFEVDGHQKR